MGIDAEGGGEVGQRWAHAPPRCLAPAHSGHTPMACWHTNVGESTPPPEARWRSVMQRRWREAIACACVRTVQHQRRAKPHQPPEKWHLLCLSPIPHAAPQTRTQFCLPYEPQTGAYHCWRSTHGPCDHGNWTQFCSRRGRNWRWSPLCYAPQVWRGVPL